MESAAAAATAAAAAVRGTALFPAALEKIIVRQLHDRVGHPAGVFAKVYRSSCICGTRERQQRRCLRCERFELVVQFVRVGCNPAVAALTPAAAGGGPSTLGTPYPVSDSSEQEKAPFMAEELMSVLLPSAVYKNVAVGMTGDARDAGAARGTGMSPMPSRRPADDGADGGVPGAGGHHRGWMQWTALKMGTFPFRGGCSGGHGGIIGQHLGDGVGDGASGLLALGLEAVSAAANDGIGGGCNDPPQVVIEVRRAGGRHVGESSDVQRFRLVVGGRGAPPNGRGSDHRFYRELGSAAAVKAAVIGDTTATVLCGGGSDASGGGVCLGGREGPIKVSPPCFR